MSESTDKNPDDVKADGADAPAEPVIPAGPETSQQRWVKYGANVLLSSVLVIALAAVVIWLAGRYDARLDATTTDTYSLKPQTVQIISGLKNDQPIKLVSLYPRLEQKQEGRQATQDFYQPVIDILDEYKRKGHNIQVETIDPVAEPVKVDQWLGEVTRKYGGNVKAYRDLLEAFPKTLEQIQKLASDEAQKINKLPRDILEKFENEEQASALFGAVNTVRTFPSLLQVIDENIQQELKEKLPDYQQQVQNLEVSLGQFSRQAEAVRKLLDELAKNEKAPKEARDYARDSLANFDQMKKLADEVTGKITGLGELKVNDIYQRLATPEGEAPPPALAVMGPNDVQLIDFTEIWKSGESTGLGTGSQGPPKLRFAGEQRITAAILSLTKPERQKVAFVRAGGPPKAGSPMTGPGPFSEIADRLRAYNFEVLEKDVTGQWAQQSMRGGAPPMPEPSDEELKGAIWIVFAEPVMHPQFGPIPGGSPELSAAVKGHLDGGGSAMVLANLQGDDLADALGGWGVKIRPDVIAVHEPVETDAPAGEDFVEMARRRPAIFVINEYGGPHPITETLQSLDAAIVPMIPVIKTGAEGVTVTQLLPVPTALASWGESDISTVTRPRVIPTFDSAGGDLPPPLWSGAAIEKKGTDGKPAGRVVVIGSSDFVSNGMLAIPDPQIYNRSKIEVARFPGNGELFTNSVFWLAKMENMIALSPTAMDTARIRPISSGMLGFWRIGVLLIGLPLLALAGGLMVYRARSNES